MLDMYPLYVADERRTNTNLCDGICARHRARRGRIPLYIYTHALASSTIRKSLTRDQLETLGSAEAGTATTSGVLPHLPCPARPTMYSALPSITLKNEMGSAGAGVRF